MNGMNGKQQCTDGSRCSVIQNGKQHAKAQEGNERMQQEHRHMPPRGVQSEKEVIQVQPRAEQRPIVGKISNQVTSAVNKIFGMDPK